MSGMCKAHAKQSSKRKNYFAGKEKCRSWDIAKDKQAKRQKRIATAHKVRQALRAKAGKPIPGSARKARRVGLQRAMAA